MAACTIERSRPDGGMADAAASKAAVRKGVRVRVPLRAPAVCSRYPFGERRCEVGGRWSENLMLVTHAHAHAVSVFLIVCAIVGLIASMLTILSVLTILSFITERGRPTRRRITPYLRRRPRPPRTHVHIEPDGRSSSLLGWRISDSLLRSVPETSGTLPRRIRGSFICRVGLGAGKCDFDLASWRRSSRLELRCWQRAVRTGPGTCSARATALQRAGHRNHTRQRLVPQQRLELHAAR